MGPAMEVVVKAIRRICDDDDTFTELNLVKNISFEFDHAVQIAAGLKGNRHLKKLILDGYRLNDDVASAFASALSVNRTLQYLSLETNDIGPAGMKALADAIGKNRGLLEVKLQFQRTKTGPEAESAFGTMFDTNTTLLKLALQFTDMTARNKVNQSLAKNNESARKAKVDNQKKRAAMSPEEIAVEDGVELLVLNSSKLTSLNLSNNTFCKKEHAMDIANNLDRNRSVKELRLSGLGLTDDVGLIIAEHCTRTQC